MKTICEQTLSVNVRQIKMQRSSGFSAAEEDVSANGVKGCRFLVAMVIQCVVLS